LVDFGNLEQQLSNILDHDVVGCPIQMWKVLLPLFVVGNAKRPDPLVTGLEQGRPSVFENVVAAIYEIVIIQRGTRPDSFARGAQVTEGRPHARRSLRNDTTDPPLDLLVQRILERLDETKVLVEGPIIKVRALGRQFHLAQNAPVLAMIPAQVVRLTRDTVHSEPNPGG
jgi:hypothetical protein